MKITSLITTALVAVGVTLAVNPARGALTYTAGDLFLGFQGTGNASDYLVNIGNVSNYSKLDGVSFTVGTFGADLSTAFDSTTSTTSWYQRSDLFWSVSGTTFSNIPDADTLYLTKARTNINVRSTAWTGRGSSAQADQVGYFQGLALAYKNFGESTATDARATFQDVALANSYASFTAGTVSDFQWGNIEGKFSVTNEAGGSVLDLYRVDPSFTDAPGTYLGKFTIDNNGTVTFTAVPEPGSLVLIGAAGLFFLVIIRRRKAFSH